MRGHGFSFQRIAVLALALVVVGFFINPKFAGAQSETELYGFSPTGVEGFFPYSNLVFDKAGNLYGTTLEGGANGAGTAFELSPNGDGGWTHTVIHTFANDDHDGVYPYAGVIFDAAGNLYGTTQYGGWWGAGSIYELSPQPGGGWTELILYSFRPMTSGGEYAVSGLIMDSEGDLYGTTVNGGDYNVCVAAEGCGTVYKLRNIGNGVWEGSTPYSFGSFTYPDGANPWAALTFGPSGSLYGTTSTGGTYRYGTVFEVTPPASPHHRWTEKVLYSFDKNGVDGTTPMGSVVFDKAGNLYGTTDSGGTYNNSGTVFKLSPNGSGGWTESIIYNFGANGDGALPVFGDLTIDNAGNLYGATAAGGSGYGTVYELSPSASGAWSETMLFRFPYSGGIYPQAGVTLDAEGNIYGTTLQAGGGLYGAVFQITR
jgi:uncharacterized repeat protein (TIGR03803 family)